MDSKHFLEDWLEFVYVNRLYLMVQVRERNFISIVLEMIGLISFLLSCALRSSHSHVL